MLRVDRAGRDIMDCLVWRVHGLKSTHIKNHEIKRRVLMLGTSINVRRVQPSSKPK